VVSVVGGVGIPFRVGGNDRGRCAVWCEIREEVCGRPSHATPATIPPRNRRLKTYSHLTVSSGAKRGHRTTLFRERPAPGSFVYRDYNCGRPETANGSGRPAINCFTPIIGDPEPTQGVTSASNSRIWDCVIEEAGCKARRPSALLDDGVMGPHIPVSRCGTAGAEPGPSAPGLPQVRDSDRRSLICQVLTACQPIISKFVSLHL
jgi:hypothetical protein